MLLKEKEGVPVDSKKAIEIDVIKNHMATMTEEQRAVLKEAPNFFYQVKSI